MTTAVHEGFQRLTEAAASGRLAAVCSAFYIDVLVVFGSVVRSEEPRDLDVAVRFSSYDPARVLPLIDTLAELTGTDKVDLMVLNRAGPVARERALVGCLPLYEAQPGLFANAQIAAIMERMDTEFLRRLDLELMAR